MTGMIDRIQQRTRAPSERARILEMADQDADEVLDALAADTRRKTFRVLFDEPATTSDLADRLDTSVQNVHHHLTTLREAGLVEGIDTVYSEKGNEMTVYGPASDPLVFVGDDERVPRVEQSLAGVVGGLALVALGSLLVQWGAERLVRAGSVAADGVGPASYAPQDPATTGTLAWLVFDVMEPGLVFFAGCLLIAAVAALVERR